MRSASALTWMLLLGLPTLKVWPRDLSGCSMQRLMQSHKNMVTDLSLRQSLEANRVSVAAAFASIALTVDGNRAPDEVWADLDAFLSK